MVWLKWCVSYNTTVDISTITYEQMQKQNLLYPSPQKNQKQNSFIYTNTQYHFKKLKSQKDKTLKPS